MDQPYGRISIGNEMSTLLAHGSLVSGSGQETISLI